MKYAGGFDKADVGKATAESMYKSGVDVIYHAAGATGTGVFTEAKNLKKKIRSGTYGLSVLIKTSTRKVKSKAQKTMSLSHQWSKSGYSRRGLNEKASDGKFPGGKTLTYGLAQDAVGISDHKENLSDDVIKATDDWKKKIADGLEIPSTEKELKSFKAE